MMVARLAVNRSLRPPWMEPPATSAASAATTAATIAPSGADLVLDDVKLVAPATLVAGPAYTVKFRNQGTAPAGKFQVALLAGRDGKLDEDAPRAVVDVSSLAAGELKEVTLRLPQKALKLAGPRWPGRRLHSPLRRGGLNGHSYRWWRAAFYDLRETATIHVPTLLSSRCSRAIFDVRPLETPCATAIVPRGR